MKRGIKVEMFFLMFKECVNDASAAANTHGEPCRAASCGGIAAANVGIFAETNKRKRRFVPNLRTGGGELLSLAPA